ncbi:uncharacterized protein LOC122083481 [Macadamia integrifolia]|uniref:uncharacterized protein LOC122083481 n=1 Tax=Macadamia integrifolia TaxID=60698 RepID=UPI001C4FE613|nr:uncharacterized protein LOC122083481 [Macadamia integrifolia]
MGKVVEKKKKKKGRPSLLDLQKRNLRRQQQQQEQQQQKRNPNSNPYLNSNYRKPIVPNPNPNRRFTRRNPYPDGISVAVSEGAADAGDDDDDDDDNDDEEDEDSNEDSNGKRREKKLKLVLRLPSNQQHRSSLNSSLNSGSYGSDSYVEDEKSETADKKRRINAVADGSGPGDAEKEEKTKSASKGEESELRLEPGPTTSLPDKKLLLFIIDRLQKKDTYGVFSDPVDPNELPDYHEIIEHPMDFGTVRMKLAGGAYTSLEQFEKDIFLICSNAMRYNSPDTIYYRQARSMQELAKKDFENLRQDSEDNEPEPRVVRRGRPPTKHLKKPPGRPNFERAGSEFSSDATLATAGDCAIWSNSHDQRKGSLPDRSGISDGSGRTFHGSRNTEAYTSWLAERKSEKNDELSGSGLKGMSVKYGKKQFVLDENRRNTYKQFHPLAVGCKPSVFNAYDGEPKQLMTVGLQAEYGYARSLARFAANLGPVAWKIASQKIERALPAGLNFGPGWVGENDATQLWPWPQPQPRVQATSPAHLLPQPSPLPNISTSAATSNEVEPKGDGTSEKNSSKNSLSDVIDSKHPLPSTATSTVKIRTPEPTTAGGEAARGLNYGGGFSLLNSSVGAIRPRPPFQLHQSPLIHNTMNGFSSGFGFNLSPPMGKLARTGRLAGNFGSEAAMASGTLGTDVRSNMHPKPVGHAESESDKLGATNTKNSGGVLPVSCQESQLVPGVGQRHSSWGGLSVHQKIDSVPPDLNVRFQSPGSPSSSMPVDSPQPDLALQL